MLNENNELLTGELKREEFATWRGVKKSTISGNKAKYLEELKEFANYHLEGKKIIIDEVLEPIFITNRKKIYNEILTNFRTKYWVDALGSCSVAAVGVGKDYPDLAPTAAYNLIRKARIELYGKPFGKHGRDGRCEFVWVKKVSATKYEFFNEKEQEIWNNLCINYVGEDFGERVIAYRDEYFKGKLTKDQFLALTLDTKENFQSFISMAMVAIGSSIAKGTLLENGIFFEESAYNLEDM